MQINNSHIVVSQIAPPISDFVSLRANCGWGTISVDQAKMALQNSLFVVSVLDKQRTIGFGRIVGDRALNFYIQDVVVDANYRHSGIGGAIISNLLDQLRLSGSAGCTVGLMAAAGKESFYRQFGFIERPSTTFGAGMTLDL